MYFTHHIINSAKICHSQTDIQHHLTSRDRMLLRQNCSKPWITGILTSLSKENLWHKTVNWPSTRMWKWRQRVKPLLSLPPPWCLPNHPAIVSALEDTYSAAQVPPPSSIIHLHLLTSVWYGAKQIRSFFTTSKWVACFSFFSSVSKLIFTST